MIVENFIFDIIVLLWIFDIGVDVLGIMGEFYVCYLFIVNKEELFGLFLEDEIFDNDVEEVVGSYWLNLY